MTEQTTAAGIPIGNHAVIQGTVISELQETMKANAFTDVCVTAITELVTQLLEISDEAVAKNELKPEIRGIHLVRKADGSPFFTVALELAETVQPADVTTITDRVQQRLDTQRTPTPKNKKLRAIDMTSDTEPVSE